jgi:hypothetical protein
MNSKSSYTLQIYVFVLECFFFSRVDKKARAVLKIQSLEMMVGAKL